MKITALDCLKGWYSIPLAIVIISILPIALLPPTARDELITHLAVPKLYLAMGRVFEIPFMSFSYFPMNIDFLYFIPMVFGNDVIPKLIHFCFALLTGMIIYFYLSEKINNAYAALGLFLYLTTPVVVQLSTTAYIDHGFAFYSTLALIGILKWREKNDLKWLILSAVSTGFALGSKYSALILLLFFCLTVTWSYSRATKNQSKAIQLGLIYFFIAILVFSPWLIRNYFWTHNPIYPLANSLFAGTTSLENSLHLSTIPPLQMRIMLYGEDIWYIMLIPFRIFWEGKDGSQQYFDGVLNPLFLFFIPFAFMGFKNSKDMKYLALISGCFFFTAFFTVDIVIRYLLPLLPVIVIFVVYGIKRTFERKRLKNIAAISLACLFIFNGWYIVNLYKKYQPIEYFTDKQTKDQYLSRLLPDYPTIAFANATLSGNAKVMLLFAGDRGYYWQREYFYGNRMGSEIINIVQGSLNEKNIKDRFSAMGATHLFIKDTLFIKFSKDNFEERQLAMLDRFFRVYIRRLHGENGYTLYEIVRT